MDEDILWMERNLLWTVPDVYPSCMVRCWVGRMWLLLVSNGLTNSVDNTFLSVVMFKNEYWFRVVCVPVMHGTSRFRLRPRVSLYQVSEHHEKCSRPQYPGQTCALFKCRQLDDHLHTLKTVKGLLHLVPPRTPRSSGYGVLYTCDLCYMLFLLYV
jgi:hypothetical protein